MYDNTSPEGPADWWRKRLLNIASELEQAMAFVLIWMALCVIVDWKISESVQWVEQPIWIFHSCCRAWLLEVPESVNTAKNVIDRLTASVRFILKHPLHHMAQPPNTGFLKFTRPGVPLNMTVNHFMFHFKSFLTLLFHYDTQTQSEHNINNMYMHCNNMS